MKKKLLATLLAVMSVFLLVACSSKDDLSGKYYGINYNGEKELALEIDGDSGKLYFEGEHSITGVDREHSTFTFVDGSEYTVSYTLDDDGEIDIDYGRYVFSGSSKATYYKENSEALKEAIEDAKNDD